MPQAPDVVALKSIKLFLAKVELDQECWVWTGALNSKGYPVVRVNTRLLYAHRVAYELFVDTIPDGYQVHHKCLNKHCVNPSHLAHVTPRQNRTLQALGLGDTGDDIPF